MADNNCSNDIDISNDVGYETARRFRYQWTYLKVKRGRQIKLNHIPAFLGIARADEEITPQVDADEDEDAFEQEMRRIWARLSEIKDQWKLRFHAEDTIFIVKIGIIHYSSHILILKI